MKKKWQSLLAAALAGGLLWTPWAVPANAETVRTHIDSIDPYDYAVGCMEADNERIVRQGKWTVAQGSIPALIWAYGEHSKTEKDPALSDMIQTAASIDKTYSWDMFLENADTPRPDMDVNTLIKNVWYVAYFSDSLEDTYDPDGNKHEATPYYAFATFKPVFFVDDTTGETKSDLSLLEMNLFFKGYKAPDKNGLNYSYWPGVEHYTLELDRNNGLHFSGYPSIPNEATSQRTGERIVHLNSSTEGPELIVPSPSNYVYNWDHNDDNIIRLDEFAPITPPSEANKSSVDCQPTHWYFYLQKLELIK